MTDAQANFYILSNLSNSIELVMGFGKVVVS